MSGPGAGKVTEQTKQVSDGRNGRETEFPNLPEGYAGTKEPSVVEPSPAFYEQVPASALIDSLPACSNLWTRIILDAEQGTFAGPLMQEQEFGIYVNAGDLYTRRGLTPGEMVCASLARGRVLELGAGFGRVSSCLREQGLEVVTTDSDPEIVSMYRARGWASAQEVTLPEIPPSLGKFDTIIALRGVISMTGELDQVLRALRRIKQSLNPGGKLIFTSSKLSALLLIPGRSPLEYRIRFIYRGFRSLWVRATALPEWLAIPFLKEQGFHSIETLDASSADGAGYYAFATLDHERGGEGG